MRLAFSLFIVFVTYVIADKETQTNDNQNVHKYHSRDMESLRQLMTMSFILPSRETVTETKIVVSTVSQQFTIPTRRTVMEMTTSTSTITCTKSVAVPCSIRQRPSRLPSRPMRPVAQSPSIISTITVDEDKKATEQEGVKKPIQSVQSIKHTALEVFLSEAEIHDLLDEAFNANEQQFPNVSPSVVQEVEPTVLQELPSRGARVADPQLMLVYGRQPEDIESAFYDGPYNPVTLPFSRRYLKPAPPTNRRYVEPAGGLQRQFLQQFFTVTRRSTVFELAISTVTPTCSEPGRIPQCPVEKKKTIDKKNEQDKESS
ncbi:uncharacterized protein LOC130692134 isoform X1 [Daphnia carinata]|uniref:uncharacterized protein LOC130692134 isoform X1 n=1 Tax=Daphnia carinata TaxID=120202 RepID=UPI002580B26C|nr:uncharacterized protein LOC130692134 isoform X1 [Daphnia carinata]